MGRRGKSWAQKVKLFLARLKKSDLQDPLPPRLLDEAGRLCRGLQRSQRCLAKLVEGLAQGRHWGALLTNVHVVQAAVLVRLRRHQYEAACLLLESCGVTEKEELVRLWNEVHYRQMMEMLHTSSLTAVQKFRCRKRHPPPASVCPGGVKSRHYPEEVRRTLKLFAREVTARPSRRQRERLAQDVDLQPQHIYNWFANYRRRQAPQRSRGEEPLVMPGAEDTASRGASCITRVAGGLPEDAGLGQTEQTRVLAVGTPGWEQAAGGQGSSGSGAFLVQPGSSLQSLSSASCPQTEAKPGLSLSTLTGLEAGREPAGSTPGLWAQDPVGCPCDSHSAQPFAEGLPVPSPAPGTAHKAVQCSFWSWDASCEGSSSVLQGSPALPAGPAASPGVWVAATVREQADLEIEGLVLRARRPVSLGAHRALLGTPPSCQGAPVPSPGGSQASAPFQGLGDSARDPLGSDTLWAAWLLCEFSSGQRT